MQNIYETFEFNKIKEAILDFNRTELGKVYVEEMTMLPSEQDVRDALSELEEIMSIITRFGPLPISNSANALKLIDIAKKTALLTPRDLSLIAEDVLTAGKLGTFLNKLDSSYIRSKSYIGKFYDLSNLEREIHRVITNALTVADNATAKLKEIRSRLKVAERNLEQKVASLAITYGSYLNDDNATIRDGHFVLPVATVNKSKVNGIVYDVSDSGATTFIEPLEIVNINNEITALKVEENDEVRRILRELTSLCLLQEKEIINNNKIISHFDFLSAKAFYANKINGVIANVSNKPYLDLLKARHPLIDERKVVSNSYHIDEDKRIIIISGPNAGGKTVSLKTVGMCALMNQCGLAVPAEKATLGYFKNIMIDIGDNQSLSDNLSTFAAHVSNLSTITHFVTGKDLVLLDELGTGTSPNEGEALALAVSDFLLKKNCFAFISSHFEKMKEYAYRREGVCNAMMVFDEKNLMPTYNLKIGFPGRSYGLEMAHRYHLDSDVINLAKKNLEKSHTQGINDVIDKLNKVLHENENLNHELKEGKRILEGKSKDINYQSKVLQSKKDTLLEDVESIKKQMIEDAKKEIDDALKILNNPNAKQHELIAAKSRLNSLNDDVEIFESNDEINVGDYAEVAGLSIVGRVTKINKEKVELLTTDGMLVKSTLNKLTKAIAPSDKKVRSKVNIDEMIKNKSLLKTELNLIGKHVDEAIDELAKYLDDCVVRKYKEVRIIHGMGTGAIRDAVRDYLDSCSFVVSYRYGESFEGSTGATVVTLK